MTQLLSSLRDVAGVEGSFVVGEGGALLGRDLPTVFVDTTLSVAGLRVARLVDAFESAQRPVTQCLLSFGDLRLLLHRFSGGVLCVLARAETRGASLRTAVRLLGRTLAEHADRAQRESAVPEPVAAAERPSQLALGTEPERARRMYRGRPLD